MNYMWAFTWETKWLIIELNRKEFMTIWITSCLGHLDPMSEAANDTIFQPFQVENSLKQKEHNIN